MYFHSRFILKDIIHTPFRAKDNTATGNLCTFIYLGMSEGLYMCKFMNHTVGKMSTFVIP